MRRRDEVYAFVRRQLDAGGQAFVVFPLVDAGEKVDVRAATAMADHLATEVLPEYRVGLLHGRLRPEAKEGVMRAFASARSRCSSRPRWSRSAWTSRARR